MANLKCPKCGSYNTGTAYWNYAAKGLRIAAGLGLSVAMALISGPAHGAHAAKHGLEEEKKERVDGHKCYHCGHEW